mmetsp:Transcript_20073/g.43547  ORF Transcript_20073/g.43547 Transcript_20073/m.43547 type:complete len:1062 (+) Transcript_20073:135-3320(+)|eukprot:CAMPEP_0172315208 /NCGR_PEP_ID=MMETSP1058-20130122/24446_1 /TAXON_ID=83371 /ORGANISM="Detonula confervacea, Strain CCMP 353" /LENGTH=1061 /DNA_ID=CAMNT_0013029247 /DNA_START=110 /DNA_END=3295 /DNA_ORIENTATION=-
MVSAEVALHEFVTKQKRLLESELRTEEDVAEGKNKTKDDGRDGGFFLRNIDVIDTSVGLYGRSVVAFGNASQQSSESDNDTSKNQSSPASTLLQAHRLTVGDEVQILPNNGKGFQSGKKSKHAGGVICAVDDVSVSVALSGGDGGRQQSSSGKGSSKKQEKKMNKEESLDDDGEMLGGNPPYALIPKSNVEVHRKMVIALDELEKHGVSHPVAGDIVMAAFEPNNPKHNTEMTRARIEAVEGECNLASSKLDNSQREAVVMALDSNSPINLIHGPPGTGKTTTVAELIRCAVHYKGWKVLVTAPSNVAVDNVLERVMSIEKEMQSADTGKRKAGSKKSSTKSKIKAVRLGHPARIQHGIRKYSLESLVQSSEGTEIVRDCRSELNDYLKTLSNAKSRPSEKRVAYREMKSLRKEIRTREEKVVGAILRHSNVVLATNVGAASYLFNRMADVKGEPISFDLVIIDEAAQALEASCWISLLRGKRAVLAGDHKQLPPTIKCSVREVQHELGRTLFERLMFAYDKSKDSTSNCRSKMLEVQYRMHQDISDWASNAMYNGKLISHESVRDRQLLTLPLVAEKAKTQGDKEECDSLEKVTLMLVDTTGCDMHETANEAGSRYNEGEVNIVVAHVHSLISTGLRAEDIAVITPYNGQVELLRKMLLPDLPKLEIRSVDGFQGGEREAVVLSLVRSSDRGGQDGIGFLRDERRLNVAVTRAKRHCAVICDCETVSKNKFIKGLLDWMEKKGEYRSGAEYTTMHHDIGSSESLQTKNSTPISNPQKQKDGKSAHPPKITKGQNTSKDSICTTNDSIHKAEIDVKKTNIESNRIALLDRIKSFSESGKKGEELNLSPSSEYDCVVASELAKQLGLGCRDGEGTTKLVLRVLKETKPKSSAPPTEEPHATNTTKFAQLDVDDESSESSNDEDKNDTPNNLLRELALQREKRQSEQQKAPAAKPSTLKKKKKKGKGKLGGTKQPQKKEKNDDKLDGLDDMDFLDAQIEQVQTSHGRKVEAKGKGYRSIVNGILLSKPSSREEPTRNNGAASSTLQAKLNAKAQDRKVKKKPK